MGRSSLACMRSGFDAGCEVKKEVDPLIDEDEVERAKQEHAAKLVREFWTKRGYAPPISLKEFRANDYTVDFLVDRCMARNNSLIIAGASKSMKTTISLHLALALASGKDFLGKFRTIRSRVLFASAESGEAVLKRNLLGMADAMGIDLDELEDSGYLSLQFWVPKLQNLEMLDYFSDCIDDIKPDVVGMDPLYKAMNGETQANLSLSGEQIDNFVSLVKSKGATPFVDDHVKRSSENAKNCQPLQLEDITGAGKAENFRQWFLVSRRSRFDDLSDSLTRDHELWLTIGGSAGHSATWGVDISETFDSRYSQVEYSYAVRKGNEIRNEAKAAVSEASIVRSQEKADAKAQAALARLNRKADELINNVYKGDTVLALNQTDIEARLGLKVKDAQQVLSILTTSKRLVLVPKAILRANGQSYGGYKLPGTLNLITGDTGDTGDSPQCVPCGATQEHTPGTSAYIDKHAPVPSGCETAQ